MGLTEYCAVAVPFAVISCCLVEYISCVIMEEAELTTSPDSSSRGVLVQHQIMKLLPVCTSAVKNMERIAQKMDEVEKRGLAVLYAQQNLVGIQDEESKDNVSGLIHKEV